MNPFRIHSVFIWSKRAVGNWLFVFVKTALSSSRLPQSGKTHGKAPRSGCCFGSPVLCVCFNLSHSANEVLELLGFLFTPCP